jgi:hypothetical protein
MEDSEQELDKESEKVIPTSLRTLLLPPTLDDTPASLQSYLQSLIVLNALECMTRQVNQISAHCSMFLIFYVNVLLSLGQPIPLLFSTDNTVWFNRANQIATIASKGGKRSPFSDYSPEEWEEYKRTEEDKDRRKKQKKEDEKREREKEKNKNNNRKRSREDDEKEEKNPNKRLKNKKKAAVKKTADRETARVEKQNREATKELKKVQAFQNKKEKLESKDTPANRIKLKVVIEAEAERLRLRAEEEGENKEEMSLTQQQAERFNKVTELETTDHEWVKSRYLKMRSIYRDSFCELLPANFKHLDRAGLTEALATVTVESRKNFNTYYERTFSTRQEKVIRHQVHELKQFQSAVQKCPAVLVAPLRNLCTRWMVFKVNRWKNKMDLCTSWKEIIERYVERKRTKDQEEEAVGKRKRKRKQKTVDEFLASDEELQALLFEMERKARTHQIHFTPGVNVEQHPISHESYRLSGSDAGKYATCYIYYMQYLSQQYDWFRALNERHFKRALEDGVETGGFGSRTKWKPFSLFPMKKMEMSFIHLGERPARSLVGFSGLRWVTNTLKRSDSNSYTQILYQQVCDKLRKIGLTPSNHIDWIPSSCSKDELFSKLFQSQEHLKLLRKTKWSKHHEAIQFTHVIDTDGVQARVHFSTKSKQKQRSKGDPSTDDINLMTRQVLDRVVADHLTLIGVDPGHINIISAIRQERIRPPPTGGPEPIPKQLVCMSRRRSILDVDISLLTDEKRIKEIKKGKKRARRKKAKQHREEEAGQTSYRLTNASWRNMTGMTDAQKKRRFWRSQCPRLQGLDLELSQQHEQCNKRTCDVFVFGEYVKKVYSCWDDIWHEVEQPKYRKLKFSQFQRKARAYRKVAVGLCGGQHLISRSVVLWGAGSFGPTLKGHSSAPNKGLVKHLKDHGVEIHMAIEDYTSKVTCCCHHPVNFSVQKQQLSKKVIATLPPGSDSFSAPHKLHGLHYCVNNRHSSSSHLYNHFHGRVEPLNPVVPELGEFGKKMFVEAASSSAGIITSRPLNRDMSSAIAILNRAYLVVYG